MAGGVRVRALCTSPHSQAATGPCLDDMVPVSALRKPCSGPFAPSHSCHATWKALGCSAHPSHSLPRPSSPLCPLSAAGNTAASRPHKISQADSNRKEALQQAKATKGELEKSSLLTQGDQRQPALRCAGLGQVFPGSSGCGHPMVFDYTLPNDILETYHPKHPQSSSMSRVLLSQAQGSA